MTLSVADAKSLLEKTLFHEKNLQVCICGGGNGAHIAAGYLAHKGIKVNVFTRKPSEWADQLKITTSSSSWEHRGTFVGRLQTISKNAASVIPGSQVVIIAAPANAHPDLLRQVAPHLSKGVSLGALYGQGGFDWAVRTALGEKLDACKMIFGLQNIPWICKITKYGHEARVIGPKKYLFVACYPLDCTNEAAKLMSELFDIPCKTVPNFLTLTLTPSNQIIHPPRYYGIFRDWDGKKTYTMDELKRRNGLTLYADMDEFSAEQMAMLDNELQQIKHALIQRFPGLDLSDVLPLGDRVIKHYGEDVADRSSLKTIFATNKGYAGCATPLVEVSPGKFIPSVPSRLFWEDIPFGLCILKSMAELLGNFPTPRIDFMIRWHQQFMGVRFLNDDNQLNPATIPLTGTPYKYGIHDVSELVATSLSKEMRKYIHPRARV